jgi:hypothetical protein
VIAQHTYECVDDGGIEREPRASPELVQCPLRAHGLSVMGGVWVIAHITASVVKRTMALLMARFPAALRG